MYRGQYVNIVGKNALNGTFTAQVQNSTKIIPDVLAANCEPIPEVNG